jgi:hypothetical protein
MVVNPAPSVFTSGPVGHLANMQSNRITTTISALRQKGRRSIDDVAGYLAWVEQNPDGSVLNTYRTPTAGYLKLHRATCRTINDRPARRYR